jgi:hypothetical protein
VTNRVRNSDVPGWQGNVANYHDQKLHVILDDLARASAALANLEGALTSGVSLANQQIQQQEAEQRRASQGR